MFPFTRRAEPTGNRLLAGVAGALAAASGIAGLGLLSPGPKDVIIAAANKYLGLSMDLNTPWWVGAPLLAFCGTMLLVMMRALKADRTDHEGKPFIAFRHHSLRNSVPPLLTRDAVPAGLGERTLSHVDCDLTAQLADGAPSNNDLKAAVEEQQRRVEYLLSSIRTLPDARAAYYGIAHVPLQVLAGRMFGPGLSPQLYELDGDRATWMPLLDGNGANLHVRRVTAAAADPLADAAIRVSLSLEVSLDDVRQVLQEPFEDIHIRLAHPARNVVTHVGQVDAICHEFRAALDSLHNRMALGGRVHLFLAVPMSVGFSLGRVLSSSVNPDVTCYNHTAQGSPRYAWGLRVNTDAPSGKVVVRPRAVSTGIPTNSP